MFLILQNYGLQKIQIGTIKIAGDILSRRVNENIDTVTNYSERYNVSIGTVQKILTNLEDSKILELEKKGKMGTKIKAINFKKILEILDYSFLLCVMPITYSQRYKKLLDIFELSLKSPIPLYFAHMRGGHTRLQLVADGVYDFGISSKLAAIQSIENGCKIEILKEFGQRSYVSKHVILERIGVCKENYSVGIDKESDDHMFLTENNFLGQKGIVFVDIRYSEALEKIIEGKIDKVIWNNDDVMDKKILLENQKIVIKELKDDEKNLLATEAVVVIRKNNSVIKNIFEQFFKINL